MTREKVAMSLQAERLAAAREKRRETGIPVSQSVQRALAHWVETGETPPPLPARFDTGERPGPKPKRKKTK